jgi:hypothetical protein
MPDLYLAKAAGGILVPIDQPSADYIQGFALDAGFKAHVREYNNPAFHRKLMSLFQHAFNVWEPVDVYYLDQLVRKNFDQFRKDVTILAGYYDVYVDIRGRVRTVARSLNFSTMGHSEREALFSAVIDVVLTRILRGYTRADLDNVLAQTMAYTR